MSSDLIPASNNVFHLLIIRQLSGSRLGIRNHNYPWNNAWCAMNSCDVIYYAKWNYDAVPSLMSENESAKNALTSWEQRANTRLRDYHLKIYGIKSTVQRKLQMLLFKSKTLANSASALVAILYQSDAVKGKTAIKPYYGFAFTANEPCEQTSNCIQKVLRTFQLGCTTSTSVMNLTIWSQATVVSQASASLAFYSFTTMHLHSQRFLPNEKNKVPVLQLQFVSTYQLDFKNDVFGFSYNKPLAFKLCLKEDRIFSRVRAQFW